ncbi:MAG: protease complex subunit PrcB family protein [Thermoanaerobaculia bacterium]
MARRTLLTILALATALPILAGAPSPKHWRQLKKGTDGVLAAAGDEGSRRAPWIELAADRKTLDSLWKQYVPGKPGDADFGSETVIFLLLGAQQTGGYAIEPIATDPPVDGVVRVHARLVQPMGDEPTTEAFTAPYAVIAVRARGFSGVEWVDADGRLLATRLVE